MKLNTLLLENVTHEHLMSTLAQYLSDYSVEVYMDFLNDDPVLDQTILDFARRSVEVILDNLAEQEDELVKRSWKITVDKLKRLNEQQVMQFFLRMAEMSPEAARDNLQEFKRAGITGSHIDRLEAALNKSVGFKHQHNETI